MKLKHLFSLLMTAMLLLLQSCDKMEANISSEEQLEVKKNTDDFVEAFNQHDVNKIQALWVEDPYFVNLTTQESFDSKTGLADHFKNLFETLGANQMHVQVSSIHFPTSDDAIAKGLAEIEYKDQHTEKRAFSAYYVKENGKWLIKDFTVNDINPPSSHYDELKDLDWLIGNWVDEDENIDVEYTYEWDKNKNFLTQYFTLSVLDEEQLSGIQIIGWDPNAKQVISWTYDSDGGFGTSKWTKNENNWSTTVDFTLPEGGKATATQIYSKVDDNSYTFTLENRNIDGKSLPNIGPFKVVRKK